MDLIFTDSSGADVGVFPAYSFDMSFGASENDFEIILDSNEATLEDGAFIYIEGTEYGGINDGLKASTNGETVTYKGRTWHGIINSKVISPNSGENYYSVSGEANAVLHTIISRLGLTSLFSAALDNSGITISKYQFARYCKGYDGIRAMLASVNAKLKIEWKDRKVYLSAVPVADYTEAPIDGDIATLTVEKHQNKVNHLICLGKGELSAREVIHLYADQFGNIGNSQYYTDFDEICDVYDNSNAESSEDLRKGGIERFKELMHVDKAEVSLTESSGLSFDIGDIIGATEYKTGITVKEKISQKIVKINSGIINFEYKTGG